MSLGFKRKNERLNEELNGKGGASASPYPIVTCQICGLTNDRHSRNCPVPGAQPPRQNDSERLGHDAVNLPEHYKVFPLEPIRFSHENGLTFLQSNIIKYIVRYPHKNGVEDLKKAARCLDMLIAFEEGDPDWWKLPGERESRRTYII